MHFLRADQDLSRRSYYAATATRETSHARLEGDRHCDVAVVGGGLAGLSAAIELADRGLSVTLLEARRIGDGASGRNGGQAIHGLACDNEVIEAQLGLDAARQVFGMTIEALDLIRGRCQRFAIDCEWRDGYLGVAIGERKARTLLAHAEHLGTVYGHPLRTIGRQELPQWIASPRYAAGVHDPRSGHLHPLKYTLGLARAAESLGVSLHEDSAVIEMTPGRRTTLRTAHGSVSASQVLLAGNVYLQGLVPELRSRIMPVGTYIVASEPVDPALAQRLIPCGAAVCDTNFVLDYFRFSADHRMLYGGRVSYSTATPANLAQSMQRRMTGTFKELADCKVDFAWGGFVDITMNRAPDFGRLDAHPSIYYVQGFSGHGLALTGMAGKLVAEAMTGDAARFDTFARLRHHAFPGGALLRTPALVLGMAWYRLKDALS